jgi:hypothetical protein
MWDPQHLTILRACTICYRDSFAFYMPLHNFIFSKSTRTLPCFHKRPSVVYVLELKILEYAQQQNKHAVLLLCYVSQLVYCRVTQLSKIQTRDTSRRFHILVSW